MDFIIRILGFLVFIAGIILFILGIISKHKTLKIIGIITFITPLALTVLLIVFTNILGFLKVSPSKSDFYGKYVLDEKSYDYVKSIGSLDTLSTIEIYKNDSIYIEPVDFLNVTGHGVFEYESWNDNGMNFHIKNGYHIVHLDRDIKNWRLEYSGFYYKKIND